MPAWTRAALTLFAVGWGANQFAALLPVYRVEDGATPAEVTLLFGAYAAGLIPALLVVAPISDRLGRRRVIRPVLALSFVATVVLMASGHSVWLLLVGRLLAGVASGAAFAPGTAWVKELTTGPAGTGARRAAIALSAGFGTGPLVAGVLAEWAPSPTVLPYVPHLVLTVAVAAVAWTTPEPTHAAAGPVDREARRVLATVRGRPFVLGIVPSAPWVFGAATLAFATVPAVVELPGPEVATGGAVVAMALWTGVLVQPTRRGKDPWTTILLGLGSAVGGFALGLVAAQSGSGWLGLLAALPLGAAYGLVLVGGLTLVEQLADPADLATVTAVFYSLTYLGFAAPYLGTLLLAHVSGPAAMTVLAALVLCVVPAVAAGRRSVG